MPEHIKSHLDEIHKTAEAAEAALKSGNTELAAELKAKLKHLFENAPEDAKTGGFIGSGGNNIPVPPKDGMSQDLSTRVYFRRYEVICRSFNNSS